MNSIYNLRNIGQETPVLTKEELFAYPSLNETAFEYMADKASSEPEFVFVFPLIRENKYGGNYIDIYIFDPSYSFQNRYILVPGHKLSDDDEVELEEKLKSKAIRFIFWDEDFVERAKLLAKPYFDKVDNVAHLLFGLCMVFYRSGIRELLFKQGLDYLAFHIGRFKEINLIATRAEDVFEMPAKALKFFNNESTYKLLTHIHSRYVYGKVYKQFASYLGEVETINRSQWEYLSRIYHLQKHPEDEWAKLTFNRRIFEGFADIDDTELAKDYILYFELKEATQFKMYDTKFPEKEEELYILIEKLYRIVRYKDYRKNYDGIIEGQALINRKYEYQDENYRVRLPRKVDDFLDAADYMHNCLEDYMQDVAEGAIMILLVDIKDEKDQIALEVDDDIIVQGKRRFNEGLTDNDMSFLGFYCSKVGLRIRNKNEL